MSMLSFIYLAALLCNLFVVFIGGQYCVHTPFGQKFLVWWNHYEYVGGGGCGPGGCGGGGDQING